MHNYDDWSDEKMESHLRFSQRRRAAEMLKYATHEVFEWKIFTKLIWRTSIGRVLLAIMGALAVLLEYDEKVCNICGHDFDPYNCRKCPDCQRPEDTCGVPRIPFTKRASAR